MYFEICTTAPARCRKVADVRAARYCIGQLSILTGSFDQFFDQMVNWNGRDQSFGPVSVKLRRAA